MPEHAAAQARLEEAKGDGVQVVPPHCDDRGGKGQSDEPERDGHEERTGSGRERGLRELGCSGFLASPAWSTAQTGVVHEQEPTADIPVWSVYARAGEAVNGSRHRVGMTWSIGAQRPECDFAGFVCLGRANRPRKQPFRIEGQLHPSPTVRVGKRRREERKLATKTTARASAKAARGSDDPAARIRLLRVITRLNVGGPALHTMLLTERLDPARYDSLLVAGRVNPDEGDYLALHGRAADRVVLVPTLRREIHPAADGAALVELVRLMRRIRPHVVHTHTAKAGVLGRIAARLDRKSVV